MVMIASQRQSRASALQSVEIRCPLRICASPLAKRQKAYRLPALQGLEEG